MWLRSHCLLIDNIKLNINRWFLSKWYKYSIGRSWKGESGCLAIGVAGWVKRPPQRSRKRPWNLFWNLIWILIRILVRILVREGVRKDNIKVYNLKYGYIYGYIQMYINKKKLYENCGQLDKLWTTKLPKITFFLISHWFYVSGSGTFFQQLDLYNNTLSSYSSLIFFFLSISIFQLYRKQ